MLKIIVFKLALIYSFFSYAKTISFSFDDIPRPDTYYTGEERSKKIVNTLDKFGVKAAFYVNSSNVSEEGLKRIRYYASKGHIIGNHTHSHKSANIVSEDVFLADFKLCDQLLRSWGLRPTYFRYPYLHRGKSVEKINSIRDHILKNGYQDGFISVDIYDWYIDSLFQKASKEKNKIDFEKLKSFYVETLYKSIVHNEKLALKVYGRSPKHVMLLHENDMAAMFIGDLIQHLKKNGWTLCTPEESYNDPDLKKFPKNILRHGQGRVVAHATEKGLLGPLVSGFEDEETLDKLWNQYQIIIDK